MTKEQKELVNIIGDLENKIKKLTRKANTCVEITNQYRLEIYNLREKLRQYYLKLKEVTDKEKNKKEDVKE